MSELQGSMHRYMLIMVATPTLIQLTYITTRAGIHKACSTEIFNKLASSHCSIDVFRRQLKIHNKGHPEKAGPGDRQFLIRLGTIPAKAQTASLISWSVVEAVLRCIKGMPDSVVQAVRAVKQAQGNPAKLTLLPLPQHMLQPCSVPSTNPVQLQMMDPLPVHLPVCDLDQEPQPRERYGLLAKHPALAKLAPLPGQVKELEQWATTPIQLDRAARSHNSVTFDNTHKNISLFLGYCRYHDVQQPTLQLFLSPHWLSKFISFKVAQKHSIYSIRAFLATAREVLKWWQTKPGGKHHTLQEAIDWLLRLSTQVWPTQVSDAMQSILS